MDAVTTTHTFPRVNSVADVVKYLSVSKRTVYSLIYEGKLVAHKLGSRNLIYGEDLEAFIASLPVLEVKP